MNFRLVFCLKKKTMKENMQTQNIQQNVQDIKAIQFGIVSDQDILDISVCQINKTTLSSEEGSVYDPRLGCTTNGVLCDTCNENIWKCPGHFGHINLNIPIILFYKQTVTMLRLFCFECCRFLCTKDELILHNVRGYSNIIEHVSKMVVCGRCGSPHPEIKLDLDNVIVSTLKLKNEKTTKTLCPISVKCIFDNIPEEDVEILGIDPVLSHPKNLVLTKFPVIPTCCRPRVITPDNISDDDLSITLIEIIKHNNILERQLDPCLYEKTIAEIKFRALTYCDNTKGKASHTTNHKPLTGIKERITKKTGHVRQNLMGKRCNRTARTVLGPEPTLKMNEVAIPQEIATLLTVPVIVSPFNIEELTRMVNNTSLISVIIKKNGNKISVPVAQMKRGTVLKHGDTIKRDGNDIVVTNCKMLLKPGDEIERNEQPILLLFPEKRHITLELGDIVERSMKNGDFVLLNRQPTLHRNSMQGMKVVIKPGKTIRMNLSIVTGFNADFDGDEGNIFAQETLEANAELELLSNAKYNILSAQSNKSEMVIVQDSLLGAYKMSCIVHTITPAMFMHCIMRIEHVYDYHKRLDEIQTMRSEKYTSCGLFGFIMPSDFHYKTKTLEIKNGIVISGYFDKSSLKGGKYSIIRLLTMEYGPEIAMSFIDNIQFLTNCWFEMFPFTVGVVDCLIGNEEKRKEIQKTVYKYFLEANKIALTTEHPNIRESRVNCSLNKGKDIGLKIAKSVLKEDNNFNSTVVSGSKGDYFNIAQITGLLGQQNLDGQRPSKNIDNNKRSLIHYPRVIVNDPSRRYRARGFVASSFIEGMAEDEMFFHAMTGRDGMIKTAMETATSGYIQRSIIKMNEDLKIEYDGTVRDARKNIYQFVFGNHGFDPSQTTNIDGDVLPVLFHRVAKRFQTPVETTTNELLRFLTLTEIEDIVEECRVSHNLPEPIMKDVTNKQDSIIRKHLNSVQILPSRFQEFKHHIITRYHTSRSCPGECVGIIGAQSIGERQTQTTLNTFHTAGKLQQTGVSRLEEILNMSKNLKIRTCTVFFKEQYTTSEALRLDVGSSINSVFFKNLYTDEPKIIECIGVNETKLVIEFDFDIRVMFINRLTSFDIALKIKSQLQNHDVHIVVKPIGLDIKYILEKNSQYSLAEYLKELDKILVCGMVGITATHLDYNKIEKEWFMVTEGSNLKKLLAHPLVNGKRLYCNDFWEVYECLGITAVRKMLLNDLKQICCGVNQEHIQLLVDKMTHKGKPCSITRYTMRTNDCGPLSKATFEESVDILITAAMRSEIENNAGVSAAVISGKQPRVGTAFMDLVMNLDVFHNKLDTIQECKNTYIPDSYNPIY